MRGMIKFDEFASNLVGDCGWFVEILLKVKEWQKGGYKITDIYVKEGRSVLIGILKNFFPVPVDDEITRDMIKQLIYRMYYIRSWKLKGKEGGSSVDEMNSTNVKSFSLAVDGLGILRITYSKNIFGNLFTIRILNFQIPSLEEVGLEGYYKDFLKSLIRATTVKLPLQNQQSQFMLAKHVNTGGLIVHCGPTGSGKTTSIAAQIDFLAKETNGMIITYEDPIEYLYITKPNVLQYEIGANIDYKEIYDHFLRSTAQVALVGEVREKETMQKVIDLASRGHIVYTTLHARTVPEALYLLRENMKENLPLLSSSLLAITSQKLILVGDKIKPIYEHLMMNNNSSMTNQIRKLIETKDSYQDFVNFFKNNEASLKSEKVYVNNNSEV